MTTPTTSWHKLMASTTPSRYELIAEAAGVRLCEDRECLRKDVEPGVVHFIRKRYTVASAFLLMRLSYAATHKPAFPKDWRGRFDRVRWIQQLSSDVGIRLPQYLWQFERALIREDIAAERRRYGIATAFIPDLETLKAAEAWARR